MLDIDEKMRTLQQDYSLERLGTFCFAIALSAAAYALRGNFKQAERLREESQAIMSGMSGPPERWRRSQLY
jgi:hypothetical protein